MNCSNLVVLALRVMSIFAMGGGSFLVISLPTALPCLAQSTGGPAVGAPSPQLNPQPDSTTQKVPIQPSFAISPSVGWVTSTQSQTTWSGTVLFSAVQSRAYCDAQTRQLGIVGNAVDSKTSSTGASATYLVNNDARADLLMGFAGSKSTGDGNIGHTQNYLSLDADVYDNNGVGLGLQQSYLVHYQRYLFPCGSDLKARRFFASLSAGAGFAAERLYGNVPKVHSTITPISAQFSYVVTHLDQAPKMIISGQVQYTPFLNDPHDYQSYGTLSIQIPTKFPNFTVGLTETDFYMNNAPSKFKRNYQSGTVQFTFSLGKAIQTPATGRNPGACYTADTLNHLYCYDGVAADECGAPSVFRPAARCSAASLGPLASRAQP